MVRETFMGSIVHRPGTAQGRRKTLEAFCDLVDYLLTLIARPAFVDLHAALQEESERDSQRGRASASPQREVDVFKERSGHDNSTLAKHARRRRDRLEAVLPANARCLGKRLAETEAQWLAAVVVGVLVIDDCPDFRAPTDLDRFWTIADSKMRGERRGDGTDQKWFGRQLEAMNPERVRLALARDPQTPIFEIGMAPHTSATSAACASLVAMASQAGYPPLGPIYSITDTHYLVEPWAPPGKRRGRSPAHEACSFYVRPDSA